MFLEIGGNRVFALTFGSGPRTFVAHSGWIATLSLLSEGWRVIVYDHRGSGETRVSPDRITADGTDFQPRKMMNISCSFDHRVIDGWDAAVFVQRLKSLLETPALLFIEV